MNTLILREDNGSTTMTCTTLCPSKEARDAAISTGMNDGTDRSYDLLEALLAKLSQ